jgi:catalase-peroxidase
MADKADDQSAGKCPVVHTRAGRVNQDWWLNQLNIQVLHHNSTLSNPMGEAFDYAEAFKRLDLNAVIKDLHALMTDSQEWWPADFESRCPSLAVSGMAALETRTYEADIHSVR